MIHRVPARYAGARSPRLSRVLAALGVRDDESRQARAGVLARTGSSTAARRRRRGGAAHEKFYDEYNAVLDMDAPYYLDTVRIVFQEFALARGTWHVAGELVDPAAITATPIFTIEGELDDISGLGQTAAALELCTRTHPRSAQLVAAGCGHYGLFSGSAGARRSIPRFAPSSESTHEPDGKTALVTGSTSGIGLGIAIALAEQGADIILNGFGDVEAARAAVVAPACASAITARICRAPPKSTR